LELTIGILSPDAVAVFVISLAAVEEAPMMMKAVNRAVKSSLKRFNWCF